MIEGKKLWPCIRNGISWLTCTIVPLLRFWHESGRVWRCLYKGGTVIISRCLRSLYDIFWSLSWNRNHRSTVVIRRLETPLELRRDIGANDHNRNLVSMLIGFSHSRLSFSSPFRKPFSILSFRDVRIQFCQLLNVQVVSFHCCLYAPAGIRYGTASIRERRGSTTSSHQQHSSTHSALGIFPVFHRSPSSPLPSGYARPLRPLHCTVERRLYLLILAIFAIGFIDYIALRGQWYRNSEDLKGKVAMRMAPRDLDEIDRD